MVYILICFIYAGCTITPKPIPLNERYSEVKKDLNSLFANQQPTTRTLTFQEALARGLKYNLDYRIKLVNIALQAGQLKIAMMTMLPALNVSGSLYKRNNKYASFGITSTGQPTDVLSSTPNTIRSARIGLSWNILDFGLGYLRAQQQGERILIAEEESRKQLQQLSQDILIAYWNAYSAQQLMNEAREFQRILAHAKARLSSAMLDKTVPKESILNFEAAILEGNRHIIKLQYKYDKAIIDLKRMLNLPLDIHFALAPPPLALQKMQDLSRLNFEKLDAITLVSRPELRGQQYQERIAKLGVKTAIVQALPGITLNEGWNYNSNKYLLNRIWVDRSVDVAWNLLNLASLPFNLETANTQVEYEKLKLMALTVTVLTETRYAYSHYESVRNEYNIALKQTENAKKILTLNQHRMLASLASEQQVITAKLRALTAKMDENLLLSDLSTALGELYLSVGSDILPVDINYRPLNEITQIIHQNFIAQNTWNFKEYVNKTYEKIFSNPTNLSNKVYNKDNRNQAVKSSEGSKQYGLQLYGSYDLNEVKKLSESLPDRKLVRFGKTKHQDKDWYVLIYGNYQKRTLANAALKKFPRKLKLHSAWVRDTEKLEWIT